jgi:hypothetical protein
MIIILFATIEGVEHLGSARDSRREAVMFFVGNPG